ncbi:ABC transporter substrate-binding protein [Cognatishimia sp. WU-CL00825]|uniref:peptide ABC transporter substrate-binding protein n=1 Tax=Cognatishimia sp. WU-CL00825 TaxID=3127658 RepID=UPI0031076ED2
MKKTTFALALTFTTALSSTAFAADVPTGTKLAADQTYTYRILDEFASLDPQLNEGVAGSVVLRDLFEGLYNQDSEGNNVPGVATHHDVSADNMTYTFHLRQDAKWSDGKPVTAHDFVYGWKRAVDPALASPYAWYMELMSVKNGAEIISGEKTPDDLGVSATDDYTFVVNLTQPLPYFAEMVTHTTTFPAPKWAVEAHGDSWIRPGNMVGNGAYTLTEHVLKERSTRVRNPNYWDNENTVLDTVVALVIGDDAQGLTRYRAGELDKTDIPAGQYPALKDEFPAEAIAVPRLCNYYFSYNLASGPEAFQDVRVRKALALALDRNVIVDQVLQGGQFPAYNFTPSATAGFDVPEIDYAGLSQAERDAMAVELLAEAGYGKGGKPLAFKYLYNTSEAHQSVAIVATQMWKQKLGIEVTLENQEWKVFLENRGNQNFEMARGAWCGDYNEASTFLDLLVSSSGYNDAKFSNARVDELMAMAKSSQDAGPLYTEVEQILSQEMPVIPVYHYSANMMLKDNVMGWPVKNVQQQTYSKDLFKVAK